ncbi:MAG TPA: quinone oxidoreductase [Planctomycetota bacterium]|nr:quinone oxidoreductase [Planctomycetota bacterium]
MPLAVRIHEPGGPNALRCDQVPLPEPGPGEVLVRHVAIGVNFIDTYHRTGLYPLPSLPHALGVEAVGVVEVLGRGVEGFLPGDRVAYAGGVPGAYAEYRTVAAERLVHVPEGIDDARAAAVLLRGMTVEYLVQRCVRIEPGMPVLVHAAAGGVGLLLCQWLAHLGAEVIGTVGNEAKARIALANGCTHVIVYTRDDFVAKVRALTGGQGVPVAFDSVGKATVRGSLCSLTRRGTLVCFGNASGKPDPIDVLDLGHYGSVYVTRPRLADYIGTRPELLASAQAVFSAVRAGWLIPHIGAVYPLTEAAEAHRALEARGITGSTVMLV